MYHISPKPSLVPTGSQPGQTPVAEQTNFAEKTAFPIPMFFTFSQRHPESPQKKARVMSQDVPSINFHIFTHVDEGIFHLRSYERWMRLNGIYWDLRIHWDMTSSSENIEQRSMSFDDHLVFLHVQSQQVSTSTGRQLGRSQAIYPSSTLSFSLHIYIYVIIVITTIISDYYLSLMWYPD